MGTRKIKVYFALYILFIYFLNIFIYLFISFFNSYKLSVFCKLNSWTHKNLGDETMYFSKPQTKHIKDILGKTFDNRKDECAYIKKYLKNVKKVKKLHIELNPIYICCMFVQNEL
jgi:hypothetical protein